MYQQEHCGTVEFICIPKDLALCCRGAHLFVKVPRPGDTEETFWVFESSCHQSNRSNVEAISLSVLSKDATSEFAGLSSHYPFNTERQAGKL